MAFVWSTWQEGIEPWRFNLNSSGGGAGTSRELFHTVMDRTLLRAGQAVSMKTHARRELLTGLALVEPGELPPTLRIEHEGSGEHFDFPLQWRAGRYAETSWKIPEDAKLGVYDVSLLRPGRVPSRRATSASSLPIALSAFRTRVSGAMSPSSIVSKGLSSSAVPSRAEALPIRPPRRRYSRVST